MAHEYQHLRDDSSEEKISDEVSFLRNSIQNPSVHWQSASKSSNRKLAMIVAVVSAYLVLLFAIIGLAMSLKKSDRCIDPSQMIYSPAQDEIEYRVQTFQHSFAEDVSEYQGWPNDEKDRLWDDLYKDGVAVHLTVDEAGDLADLTEHVAVQGYEDQYLLGLAVSHDLHCLDVLRKSFFPERYDEFGLYWTNGTINKMGWRHIDHCIDNLRQSIMCHADLSTVRFRWLPKAYFMKPQMDVEHTCRNFERVNAWAAQRSIAGHFKFNAHVEEGEVKIFPDIYAQ